MTLNEVIATAKDAGFDGVILEMIAHTYKLGTENEREACAKVCSRLADEALVVGDEDAVMCFEEAENTIRARGEAQ